MALYGLSFLFDVNVMDTKELYSMQCSSNCNPRRLHHFSLSCSKSVFPRGGFRPRPFHLELRNGRISPFRPISRWISERPCQVKGENTREVVTSEAILSNLQNAIEESMAIKPPSHPTYDLNGIIKLALAEDSGDQGDVTCMATIPTDMEAEAYFLAKEDGIVAGISLAEMIFREVNPSIKVEWIRNDGDYVHKGLQFGKAYGKAHDIVVAERVVLNFMQRMSGIATLTKAMAEAAYPARILETRKTAPGLRLVDKWAVLIGGGRNHRMGLFDMVMVKDNHISVAGGIVNAIRSVDKYLEQRNLQMDVEVETRTIDEIKKLLDYATQTKTHLTRIMLDNMVVPLTDGDVDVSMLKEAVELVNGRFETEASGNITLETLAKIGQTGVTYVSSGALTHSVKALDISLKIDTELALEVGRRTKRA